VGCNKLLARFPLHKTSIAVLALFHFSADAGDLKLTSNVQSTVYASETEQSEADNQSNLALSIQPQIVAVYDSKKVDLSVKLSQTLVEQDRQIDGADKNYTDLTLDSKISLIDKVLQLSVRGDQSYRVVNQQQDLFSDRLLSAGDLSKVSRYSTNLTFTTPNPSFVGFDWSTGYSDTSSEKSVLGDSRLDGNNVSGTSRLYSGKNMQTLTYDVNANYNKSNRSSFSDFTSTILSANIRFKLFDKFRLVLTGNDNNYDIDLDSQTASRSNLDSRSYGGGFGWYARNDRMFQLTYNKLEEGSNTSNFVGLDVDWAFSQRTKLKANYGKRFYGDAYSLQFDYQLKTIKSSLSYSENVTTFARYAQTSNTLGLFVCDIGSTDFATCFQPEELNFELPVGQEFRVFSDISSDITNEVILSKSGRYELGYDKGKMKVALNLGYQQTEYLESNRLQKYKTAGLIFNYDLNRRTDVSINTQYVKRDSTSTQNSEDTISVTFSGKRAVSRNTDIDVSLRWLDRSSEVAARDATDKRITVGLNYTF
jgi:uncharacterized protein (PEP-CTERM system associated)